MGNNVHEPLDNTIAKIESQKASYKEKIIAKVNGSMSIEGMELTELDKDRIRNYAFDFHQVDKIVSSLVKKHTVVR